ncbi:hypothetical protein JB92DRAFT_3113379 [Gautieria morchelliformis]|nr:hypothetical protein JB92DRAFT_3113379 [Gautieria morchelliformis]
MPRSDRLHLTHCANPYPATRRKREDGGPSVDRSSNISAVECTQRIHATESSQESKIKAEEECQAIKARKEIMLKLKHEIEFEIAVRDYA